MLCPWVEHFTQEALSFPAGANDEQLDTISQAVNQLRLHRIDGQGDDLVQPEEYDVVEEQGYYLSPF